MNSRGSIWRKWDLHIHSNASDGSASCKQIISQAKKAGISVIALTDHHTARNIDSIKEIGKTNDISVISGIEFRTEYGKESVHLIGLFPEQFDGMKLNTKTLTELILDPLNLSESRIIQKGKEKKSTEDNQLAFKLGMFLVQVDFKEAANLIHKYGGLVAVHAGSKSNSLDEEMRHFGNGNSNTRSLSDCLGPVKEELFKEGYIDICEIRTETDNSEFYLHKFNKPSIIASDAHNKNDIGSKYVWIKADTTFEGLRQITFEPESRVCISETRPEKKNDYFVINKITMEHPDFGKQVIKLNQNLNSIIGGRSSGKSILLGAIAKSIGTDKQVKSGKSDYNKYIEENIVPSMQIHWLDGLDNIDRKIDYFPQNYINTLAADSSEVKRLIESVIKIEVDKKITLDDFQTYIIRNRTDINNYISEYFQWSNEIDDTKEHLLSLGSKDGIRNQIEIYQYDLSSIKSKMTVSITDSEEKKYNEYKNRISQITKETQKLSNELHLLESTKNILHFESIEASLTNFSEEIKSSLSSFYQNLVNEFEEKWKEKIEQIVEANSQQIKNNKSAINNILSDSCYIKCEQYYSENITYHEISEKIQKEQSRLDEIIEKEEQLRKKLIEVDRYKQLIFQTHDNFFTEITKISVKINFIKDDVEIYCFTEFDKNRFKQVMSDKFNQRAFDIQALVNFEYKNNDDYLTFLNTIFDRIIEGTIPLKNNISKQQAIIDIFANTYYEIGYDVRYDNDSLSQMSEGKKAFIIMKMLLDFNDSGYPILIDQPEDDLDNRAIYADLVTYIRKKKIQRQIILVTHNPNIVVGGDSELVICANQNGIKNINTDDRKFEYCSGSLENSYKNSESLTILHSQGIKEHVCDILEGGNEAFLQREQKYMIKV